MGICYIVIMPEFRMKILSSTEIHTCHSSSARALTSLIEGPEISAMSFAGMVPFLSISLDHSCLLFSLGAHSLFIHQFLYDIAHIITS